MTVGRFLPSRTRSRSRGAHQSCDAPQFASQETLAASAYRSTPTSKKPFHMETPPRSVRTAGRAKDSFPTSSTIPLTYSVEGRLPSSPSRFQGLAIRFCLQVAAWLFHQDHLVAIGGRVALCCLQVGPCHYLQLLGALRARVVRFLLRVALGSSSISLVHSLNESCSHCSTVSWQAAFTFACLTGSSCAHSISMRSCRQSSASSSVPSSSAMFKTFGIS